MKIAGNFLFWFFVSLIALILTLGTYFYADSKFNNIKNIISPLPQLLKHTFYSETQAQSFWFPNLVGSFNIGNKITINSHAAISYDLTTDKLLFSKNINVHLPIASLTKIMTAVIVLENMKFDSKIPISKEAATIGEDSMGLSEGEKLSVEELLYGLLLNSGNDAAEALAQGNGFTRDIFVHLMNKKAEDLALSDTRFTNPSGLEGDGSQYSTVKDLLILTRYALERPEFAKIVATYEYDILQDSNHKAYTLYNETNLLTSYEGVKGIKTGYTDEAGMCLVTYLDYKGHKIIAVLLNSENRRSEMKALLDYSLKNLGVSPPLHS
jgi:D-alanyl-D-alanine carboxypeptidase (penicillin-binding protein 5/6)